MCVVVVMKLTCMCLVSPGCVLSGSLSRPQSRLYSLQGAQSRGPQLPGTTAGCTGTRQVSARLQLIDCVNLMSTRVTPHCLLPLFCHSLSLSLHDYVISCCRHFLILSFPGPSFPFFPHSLLSSFPASLTP